MLKFGWLAIFCIVGVVPSLCQNNALRQTARKSTSAIPPPSASCTLSVVSLKQINGSLAYRRLKYQIESLTLGQEAVDSLGKAYEEIQKANNITSLLSSMLPATDEAKDDYNCAAYIAQISPTDADNKAYMRILANAYKAEASVIDDMVAHTKEQMLRNNPPTKAQQVHDAERSATRTKRQNEAATTILEMTTYTLLLSVDLSDKNAKTTEYLAMTCTEKADLESAIEKFAAKPESAFTTPATFIKKVLTEHKCHTSR